MGIAVVEEIHIAVVEDTAVEDTAVDQAEQILKRNQFEVEANISSNLVCVHVMCE